MCPWVGIPIALLDKWYAEHNNSEGQWSVYTAAEHEHMINVVPVWSSPSARFCSQITIGVLYEQFFCYYFVVTCWFQSSYPRCMVMVFCTHNRCFGGWERPHLKNGSCCATTEWRHHKILSKRGVIGKNSVAMFLSVCLDRLIQGPRRPPH